MLACLLVMFGCFGFSSSSGTCECGEAHSLNVCVKVFASFFEKEGF